MKKQSIIICTLLGLSIVACSQLNNIKVSEQTKPQWKEIEQVFNRKGSTQGNVVKFTFPRNDLHVTVDGISIQPSLALTSWIALKPVGLKAMLMGDLVLLEKEVVPVTEGLIKNGMDVTALHNHLLGESPKVMYLHVSGQGNPTELANKIKQVLSLTKTPLISPSTSPSQNVNWSKVESILGVKGTPEGDLLHISVPRAENIKEMNTIIPPAMGVATAINLQMIGEKAATTGDFVLLANEVNPVIRMLTTHGIKVTAVHNHMLRESPRLFYLHFWGLDEPEKLSFGLKEALNQTHSNISLIPPS